MDDSFFVYLQQLEVTGFFSGYPLVYALVMVVSGTAPATPLKKKLPVLLSYAYALTGTLYLGLLIKDLYPVYGVEKIFLPWFRAWGISTLIFWIRALAKKPVTALLHSLVFFILLITDFTRQQNETGAAGLKTDLKLYTNSLLFNITCLLFIVFIYLFARRFRFGSK